MDFGILGALHEEVLMLKKHVLQQKIYKLSKDLTITTGTLGTKTVCFAYAGVGTIFAAMAATAMLTQFNVAHIVFTGVAGGLKVGQKVGDIVIATDTINYDVNCTNFVTTDHPNGYLRGHHPISEVSVYQSDSKLLQLAVEAAPHAHLGRVATGSEFVVVERKHELAPVWAELGNPVACEMEMAAVAQVCHAFECPFLGIRALSDTMDGDASRDFHVFLKAAANKLWPIVFHIITKSTSHVSKL